MELIETLLEQQPLMALFLTIAIGYLVGEINVKGFSLGVGAVLFVALAMGWFAPKSVPSAMVGTLGLALFLYGVGVQYGTQFFIGLTSRGGLWANMIALTGVLAAGAVSLAFMKMMDLKLGHALGLFAGSGTSTATLQAAVATLGNDDPAVGYSVAYPLGVGGPILFLYIAFTLLKPKIQAPTGTGLELLEIAVRNPELSGKSLGELMTALPGGVQIVALRREGRNEPGSPNFVIAENDVLLATASSKEALAQAGTILGEAAHGHLVTDRRDLDYLRVFASRPTVVGRTLGDLDLPGEKASVLIQVRRGDTDILPRPDLVLEFGDRVGVLAHRGDFTAMRKYFGDSIKGTAEFSYISIGIGMALGFLVGAIQLPLPGIGKLSVGLAGVLIMALMKSTAAKLSALIAVTDWGYGADYARAWPYRYGTHGVWFGAPRTYTDVSNYTEGTMILDVVETRTNKLVFRGTGTAVIGGPESNAGKIRDAVKKMVAALASAATR